MIGSEYTQNKSDFSDIEYPVLSDTSEDEIASSGVEESVPRNTFTKQ